MDSEQLHASRCLRASPEAAARLAALARRALPEGWSREAFRAEIEHTGALVWVVEPAPPPAATAAAPQRAPGSGRDAPAVAWGGLVARPVADEIDLLWLAVDPRVRRRGVGGRLLAALTAHADACAAQVVLEARASNRAARALYAAAGFVVAGRRPRYYRDGEDALRMIRAPRPAPANRPGAADAPTR